jgi:hypothetical protein
VSIRSTSRSPNHLNRGRLSEARIAVYVPTPQLEKLRRLADHGSATLSTTARRLLALGIDREIAELAEVR